jgi:acetylornithine deacetylase/succinyl-diaminopimelate desuccinylase-like protein
VGIEARLYESEPGRTSVVAHWGGGSPGDGEALLLHGHLDVVPAAAEDWQVDPFSGRTWPARAGRGRCGGSSW